MREYNKNRGNKDFGKMGITVNGENVQIVKDVKKSVIVQNNCTNNSNVDELCSLIELVKKELPSLGQNEDIGLIQDSLDLILEQVLSPAPKKSLLRNAVNTIKGVKGTVEFGAAVATLLQFLQNLI